MMHHFSEEVLLYQTKENCKTSGHSWLKGVSCRVAIVHLGAMDLMKVKLFQNKREKDIRKKLKKVIKEDMITSETQFFDLIN